MTAVTANAVTAPRRDDRPVLAAAPLRPGFDRRDLSRYDDPSWDSGRRYSGRTRAAAM